MSQPTKFKINISKVKLPKMPPDLERAFKSIFPSKNPNPATGKIGVNPTNNTPSIRYPIVQFEYPDSKTNKMVWRSLKLVSADEKYIKGYEMGYDGPKFKQYSLNRIATKWRINRFILIKIWTKNLMILPT